MCEGCTDEEIQLFFDGIDVNAFADQNGADETFSWQIDNGYPHQTNENDVYIQNDVPRPAGGSSLTLFDGCVSLVTLATTSSSQVVSVQTFTR